MRWTRWLAVLPGTLACSIPRVSRGGLERFWEPRFFLPWNRLTGLGDSMATGFQNRPGIRDPILLAPLAAVLQHPERDTAVSKPPRNVTRAGLPLAVCRVRPRVGTRLPAR